MVLAALAQLRRQNLPVTCEYRLAPPAAPKDGAPHVAGRAFADAAAERWVRDVQAPHFDAEGRLTGWEGVLRT